MPPPQKMSAKQFADNMRAQVPELIPFSDSAIVEKAMEHRKDLADKIDYPTAQDIALKQSREQGDAAASREQNRLQGISPNALISPEFWQNHPNMAGLAKGGLDLLPGVGAMAGGALATPETLGLGTVGGAMVGTGLGRSARDMAAESLGLENVSPLQKGLNIMGDSALSLGIPAAINAIGHPIDSLRGSVGVLSKFLPKNAKSWLEPQILEDFVEGGKPKIDPFQRPPTNGPYKSMFDDEMIPTNPNQPIEMTPKPPVTNKIKLSAQGNTITNKETGEIVHQSQPPTTTPTTPTAPKVKGLPPNQQAKMFRGAHDPVTIEFTDPDSRDLFGAGQGTFTNGSTDPNKVQRFGNAVMKVTKKYGIEGKEAGKLVHDYNAHIRQLGSALPREAESGIIGDLKVKAPSFDEFVQSSKTSPKIDLTEKTVPKELQANTPNPGETLTQFQKRTQLPFSKAEEILKQQELQSPTNISPKFNPKGQRGQTGTSKSLDDIINELIIPKIEEE